MLALIKRSRIGLLFLLVVPASFTAGYITSYSSFFDRLSSADLRLSAEYRDFSAEISKFVVEDNADFQDLLFGFRSELSTRFLVLYNETFVISYLYLIWIFFAVSMIIYILWKYLTTRNVSGVSLESEDPLEWQNQLPSLEDQLSHFRTKFSEANTKLDELYRNPEFRIVDRLEMELAQQAKRGNVNLLIGIAMSIFGFAILGYAIISTNSIEQLHTSGYLAFFAKVSLSFLLQVFSYFFLSLYKTSLFESKYFQNEITNVQSKFAAANKAQEFEKKTAYEHVLQVLANTERNFKLGKDESTVELRQQSLSNQQIIDLLNQNTKAMESISGALKKDGN